MTIRDDAASSIKIYLKSGQVFSVKAKYKDFSDFKCKMKQGDDPVTGTFGAKHEFWFRRSEIEAYTIHDNS